MTKGLVRLGNRKILITGGSGFIGFNLASYLRSLGCVVTLLDIRPARVGTDPLISFLHADLRSLEASLRSIRDVDAVVHLAAAAGVPQSIAQPGENFASNVQATFHCLEACRINAIPRFVFASSNAAVGKGSAVAREDVPPAPVSPYGAAKAFGEAMLSAYAQAFGLHGCSLRFSNVYGPHCEQKESVIALFIRKAFAGDTLSICGDGSQTRDFIHVDDICQAIALGLKHNLEGDVFQIGTGVETSIVDLIRRLEDVSGRPLRTVLVPRRRGDVMRSVSDISKARRILGYAPGVSLEEGLGRTWRWLQG